MKICFVVSSGKAGLGGHHFSVRDLGLALRDQGHDVFFVTLGKSTSIVLEPYGAIHISINPFEFRTILYFRNFLKKNSFDTIFCLDEDSTRYAMVSVPEMLGIVVPIKPGGINSSAWTGRTTNFVCFSKENYDYMLLLPKYKELKLHLIPNRVNVVAEDSIMIESFRKLAKLDGSERLILIVARIAPNKKIVFENGLHLYHKLKDQNNNFRAVIVGIVCDESTHQWLLDLLVEEDDVPIISEKSVVKGVSRIFGATECLVAMGRTAMEAMSLGKVVFVPSESSELPFLLCEENFEAISSFNFSSRFKMDKFEVEKNIQLVEKYASDTMLQKRLQKETFNLFDKHLNILVGLNAYSKIINSLHIKYNIRLTASVIGFVKSYIRLAAINLKAQLMNISLLRKG